MNLQKSIAAEEEAIYLRSRQDISTSVKEMSPQRQVQLIAIFRQRANAAACVPGTTIREKQTLCELCHALTMYEWNVMHPAACPIEKKTHAIALAIMQQLVDADLAGLENGVPQ